MPGLRIAALLLGITIGLEVTALSGIMISRHVAADTPAPVAPHRHYKMTASGEKVYVGPNLCDNATTAQGYYALHRNVHLMDPGINYMTEPCWGPSWLRY
jgi:hypothetical protein